MQILIWSYIKLWNNQSVKQFSWYFSVIVWNQLNIMLISVVIYPDLVDEASRVDADWLWKSTLICFWTCPPSTPWRAGGPTHCNSVPWCHTCNAITIPSVSHCMTSTKCLLMVFIEIAISSAQFIVLQSSGGGEHRCMMVWTWLPFSLYIHWSLLFTPSSIQYCLSRSIVTQMSETTAQIKHCDQHSTLFRFLLLSMRLQ